MANQTLTTAALQEMDRRERNRPLRWKRRGAKLLRFTVAALYLVAVLPWLAPNLAVAIPVAVLIYGYRAVSFVLITAFELNLKLGDKLAALGDWLQNRCPDPKKYEAQVESM
jgi:Flp pilus assembly protein TadB